MAVKARLTVVALLPNNVKADDFKLLTEKIIDRDETAVASKLYHTTLADLGIELSFAKISKVVEPDEINNGWHLRVTERFRKAGCENVAWRVTRVTPDIIDPENTTESFPQDLFHGCFTDDNGAIVLTNLSGTFGSETFWESFEDGE